MAATWTSRPTASSSNRRALMIALVFGLLSAFLVYRLLTSVQPKSAAVGGTAVVVAKQDIPARTMITADMVTTKPVPDSLKLASVLTDTKVAVGKAARQAIPQGDQVTAGVLANNPSDLGFSGTVPPGMRAMSISITEVSTEGGLIQPGDHVDVIGIYQQFNKEAAGVFYQPDASGPKALVALTVLQNVQVLAFAQTGIDNSAQGATKVAPTKGQPDAKSVTLAVTPEDAERLALGQQTGIFHLSLHGIGDSSTGPLPQLSNLPGTYQSGNAGQPDAVATPQSGGR